MVPKVTWLVNSETVSPKFRLELPAFKPVSPVRCREGSMKINISWLNKAAVNQGHDG